MATIQQTLVVDAARQTGVGAATEGKDETKNIRRRETIFGPDVGEDDEPGWTKPAEGATVGVDVVKGWVDKAKGEEVGPLETRTRVKTDRSRRVFTPPPHFKRWSTSNAPLFYFSSLISE